ncbi:MAG: MmgE/PrpD family protein [Deltaproteobacteria bacterium]|nr:MmgE/PrpD family protein [Deltaproteobacteria bacterium]
MAAGGDGTSQGADAAVALADWISRASFSDLAERDVIATRKIVFDTLATLLAGSSEPPFADLAAFYVAEGGRAESSILVHGGRVPARHATIVNSAMARALDFDDAHEAAIVHTGAPIVPAALAVAERIGGASGRELMTAVAVAQDLMIRLSLACESPPILRGRPGSYVFGTLATAAATAKLMNFDAARTLDALGNAFLRAAGSTLGYEDGALAQRVLQGLAAGDGVQSALLAEIGIGGAHGVLEGLGGYFQVYEGGRYHRDRLLDDLGRVHHGTTTSLKPYPVHRGMCLDIDAALAIARENEIDPEQIERVRARFPARFAEGMAKIGAFAPGREDPKGPVEPHFSNPWGVAVALVLGSAPIEAFTEQGVAYHRDRVLPVARKVEGVADPELEGRPGELGPRVVEVFLRDGRVLSQRVESGRGSPDMPLDWADLEAKFADCATRAARPIDAGRLREITSALRELEQVDDVRCLCALLG